MTKIKSLIGSKSKSSKFNSNKSYSSFWMNDNDFYSSSNSRWGGLTSTGSSSSNTVKVIKLQSYRKAIANFVKILTKQDIPVYFAGDTSYTDFKKVVLSTDIKDNNFDVAVGLALHEASHLILTDRDYLPKMLQDSSFRYSYITGSNYESWKNLLNWIEDRRIDQYIFATSPGYKAYYHKMYDHYWNNDAITKGLQSKEFRDPSIMDSWMFRIVNSLNAAADVKALPRLGEVLQLIDTKSIKRLKSTADSGQLAAEVLDIILTFMAQPQSQTPEPEGEGEGQPNGGEEKADNKQDKQESEEKADNKQDKQESEDPQDNNDDEFGDDETQGGEGDDEQDGQGSGSDSEEEETEETEGDSTSEGEKEEEQAKEEPKALSAAEQRELDQAIKKQQKFLNGEVEKMKGAQALTNQLRTSSASNAEIQQVGDGNIANTAIVYDLTKDSTIMELASLYERLSTQGTKRISKEDGDIKEALESKLPRQFANNGYSTSDFKIHEGADGHEKNAATAIQRGLEMGAILGRKMQIRSESRELVTNRMNTGHIDNKRLAQAGFGIENIFKQITIDNYKKANLHISLDASGSMGGVKWNNTIMMTTAICKAISMIQNLEVQVSLRITDGSHPVVATIYDSRKNKLRQLTSAFAVASTSYMTPEGLCFDAQIKKNLLVPGSKEVDSYFLNLSDGSPGGCGNYYGPKAIMHTKKQMETLRGMNIGILGFFMTESDYCNGLSEFRQMYGAKDSKQVKASDAMQIAKAMNELFMKKN